MSKLFVLNICLAMLLTGCVSIMKTDSLTDVKPMGLVPIESNCQFEKQIEFASRYNDYSLSHKIAESDPGIYKEHFKLINEFLAKVRNESVCKKRYKLTVEIINSPIEEKKILEFINIVSLGIIPYWNNNENKMIFSFHDDSGNKSIYESKINYSSSRSVLFLPFIAFFTDSEVELDLKLIPVHLNQLTKIEAQKSDSRIESKP